MADELVAQVLTALETLPAFDYPTYQDGIKNILGVDTSNWSAPCDAEVYGEDPDGSKETIRRFKILTIALGVSRNSEYGFSGQVAMSGIKPKLVDTSSALVYPVYRQALDDHLRSKQVNYTVTDLVQDVPFCKAYAAKILQPSFINDSLIARFEGQAVYTEAIAYLYERIRPTLNAQNSSQLLEQPQIGDSVPFTVIAQSSLPQIKVFSDTARASRELQAKSLVGTFLETALPIVWSTSEFLQQPRFPTLGLVWANIWVADTYATQVVSDLIHNDVKSFQAGFRGAMMAEIHGDVLWQWMKQQQSNGYGDIFQVTGSEDTEVVSPFGGCFEPDTEVAVDDGSVKIGDVAPGTMVLSRAPDEFGMTSTERVENPTHHQQVNNIIFTTALYGFNGEAPFVSAGHIFQTLTGSKAIEPALSCLDNDDVRPGQLVVGDVLLRLRPDRSGYERVRIESIESAPAKCRTIYGIHFAKGFKVNTYHANGYWVRENYPELTIDSLSNKYYSMSLAQQKSFIRTVADLPDSFATVLGPVVFNVVQSKFSRLTPPNFTNSKALWLKQLERSKRSHVGVTAITGQFTLIAHQLLSNSGERIDTTSPRYTSSLQRLHESQMPPRLTLHNGVLAMDEVLVDYVATSHLTLQWSRQLPEEDDLYEHGALRLIYHGLAASGYTALGPAKVESVDQLSSVKAVAAVSDANIYHVQCSGVSFKDTTLAFNAQTSDAQDNWAKFWTTSIGIVFDKTGGASVNVAFPELDTYVAAAYPDLGPDAPLYKMQPISIDNATETITITIQTVSGMGDLVFLPMLQDWSTIKVTDPVEAGPGFETVVLTLNLMTNAMHGYYTKLLPGDLGGSMHALATSPPSAVAAARRTIDQHKTKEGHEAQGNSTGAGLTRLPNSALSGSKVLATKFFDADNLSVADLQTIVAPNDTSFNTLSQTYLQNASTYWRASTEADVFGNEQSAVKSTLPPSGSLTDNLAEPERTWLGQYNKALLMQALQRDKTYTARFNDLNTAKLDYYFQGGQKGCLSVAPEYNTLSAICGSEAFLAQTPALQAYINDSQDWGKMFYNYETTDEQLNNQSFSMLLSPGTSLTNRYAMILNSLGKGDAQYDVKLWNLVRDKITASTANGTISSTEAPAFLQEFMVQLITQIQAGTSDDLFKELKIDVQNMYDTYQTEVAEEIAARTFNSQFELGECLLEAMNDFKDAVTAKNKASFSNFMSKWETKITTKFPEKGPVLIKSLRAATSIIGLAMDGFSLYMSIKWFMGWKDLSDADRASAVIGFVQTVVMTAQGVSKIIQLMRGKDPGSFDFRLNCVRWNNEVGAADVGGRKVANVPEDADETTALLKLEVIESIQNPEGATMSERLAQTAQSATLAEDTSKTFSLVDTIGSVIAVAANVASAVCMGFQIKQDFGEGQPPGIKAMDILSEVTTCLQVVSGIVEVGAMVLGVESMAIPVVGFVIAFVGIVLMFCEMFVPRSPPEDPVDKYLDDNLDTFFAALPSRPALTLNYSVTSSVKLSTEGSLVVTITNPTNTTILFQSISVTLPAGDQDTQLFLAPSGTDKSVTPPRAPTTNIISYGISEQSAFVVNGSPVPNQTNSTVVARITPASKDVKGVTFPSGLGVTLTITGMVNAKAGTAKVTVQEAAVSRPNVDIPNKDYYTYFNVQKQ